MATRKRHSATAITEKKNIRKAAKILEQRAPAQQGDQVRHADHEKVLVSLQPPVPRKQVLRKDDDGQ